MSNRDTTTEPTVDPVELAALGEGQVAYVRALRSDDVRRLFPQVPQLQPGLQLFALLSASGAPIMLTDSRDAAVANAWANDLRTVSLH
ncbi:MAG TPA: DUF1150 domain-containing protein [Microvirga sp.]|jgi:hypothetical protein|nr:DUF1150 domain-containing protein [Microvirga sp.]